MGRASVPFVKVTPSFQEFKKSLVTKTGSQLSWHYGSKGRRRKTSKRKKRMRNGILMGGGEERERERREGERSKHFFLLPHTQKAQLRMQSPLRINILLQINKTTALPPSNFAAKQFVEGKGWNVDIPFSCFRNLRTLSLVGFQIDGIN